MSVHTYNSSVLIGNWNEDICLEEDHLKDFLQKKENGELMIQKASNLLQNILKKVTLSVSHDGFLHFNNVVCLYHPATESMLSANMSESKMHEAKNLLGPCGVSAAKMLQPCVRNAFMILSTQEKMEGEVLTYGQHFYLSTLPGLGGGLKLTSDTVTFNNSAKKSRQQEVILTETTSFMGCWKILCFDPLYRLETEGMPVPANQRILLCHCKTHQNLSALPQYSFRTPFGRECEVTAHTLLDSHKAEMPVNHWVVLSRSVEDSVQQLEQERQQEFKNLVTKQQDASAQAPEEQLPPPDVPPGEVTEHAPAQ